MKITLSTLVLRPGLALLPVLLFGCAEPPASVSEIPWPELAGSVTVFEHCRVVTMTDDQVLADHSVVVAAGEIVAIEPSSSVEPPAGVERLDCAGRFLAPGLTDAHVHIGHPSELLSYLRYGVTTVFHLSGDSLDLFTGDRLDILGLRASVAKHERPGPRIFSAGQSLDGDPATGPFQKALPDVAAARQAVVEQHESGYDFIKVYDSLSPELHGVIIDEAERLGMPVFGHVPEAVGVAATLGSKQRVIAHAEEFYPEFEAVDGDDAAAVESIADRLAREALEGGVTVIPNTAFIRGLIRQLQDLDAELARPDVRFLAPPVKVWWQPKYNYYVRRDNVEQFLADTQAKYRWLLPLVSALHRHGVPLLAGSDASIPVALPGQALHEELADLVAAGLSPYEALRTATANVEAFAAQNLSEHRAFGTLRIGSTADLMMIDGHPLESLDALRQPVGVMARGQWFTPDELTSQLEDIAATFPAE